jgi:hypothetical protein
VNRRARIFFPPLGSERYAGTISVESEGIDRGTTISVLIPIATADRLVMTEAHRT